MAFEVEGGGETPPIRVERGETPEAILATEILHRIDRLLEQAGKLDISTIRSGDERTSGELQLDTQDASLIRHRLLEDGTKIEDKIRGRGGELDDHTFGVTRRVLKTGEDSLITIDGTIRDDGSVTAEGSFVTRKIDPANPPSTTPSVFVGPMSKMSTEQSRATAETVLTALEGLVEQISAGEQMAKDADIAMLLNLEASAEPTPAEQA